MEKIENPVSFKRELILKIKSLISEGERVDETVSLCLGCPWNLDGVCLRFIDNKYWDELLTRREVYSMMVVKGIKKES